MDLTKKTLGNRYNIIEKIGTGGMADVYKGTDLILGRIVAVKVLHPQYAADENFVSRFKREAQAAANLNHPNIVSVYDWGYQDDFYFLVMEYLEGKTLKEVIKERGALSAEIIIDIAKQVCSALAAAHKNEVVHRDIKPHNIIITRDGEVKVADFGIARSGTTSMTETGSVMGTAYYVAPEQVQGHTATAASDIYSLGVVLFEMATGQVPFTGENAIAVAMKHVQEAMPKPSDVNPSVQPALESIIMKALARNPARRYESAVDLKNDLIKMERGIPIKEFLPTNEETVVLRPQTEAKAGWQRKLFTLTIIFAVFILFIAVSYFLLQVFLFSNKVEVPPLKGKTFEQAQELLRKADLEILVESRDFSDSIQKDSIISQIPEAGYKINKGDTVRVIISKGIELVVVPKIIGELEINAGTILGEKGLKLGEVKRVYSEDVPEDTVITQIPKAGAKVERGTAIEVIISRGVELVFMPDLVGKSTSEAATVVKSAGLKQKTIEEYSDSVETGFVIRQSPIPGTEISKGAEVEVFLSKGPETIEMPDMTDRDGDDAQVELTKLGFTVSVQLIESDDTEQVGKVISQSPKPGDPVKRSTTVTLWVGK